MCGIRSGSAEQHSQTETLRICQCQSRFPITVSSATRFWQVTSANWCSFKAFKLRARSDPDVDMRQSSRKGTEVSKGVFQSMVEACMYCRRNRIASTLNIFSMAASLPVSSLNRRWIGPAMKSNPALGCAILQFPGRTASRDWTNARCANGLRDRRCWNSQRMIRMVLKSN